MFVEHLADGVENIVAPHHLDGREIACAFWNRGFYHDSQYFLNSRQRYNFFGCLQRGEREEGRGKREKGRGKREEGRGSREEGKGSREKGKGKRVKGKGKRVEGKGSKDADCMKNGRGCPIY